MVSTLKDAVYEVVHNSGVPVKVLADDTGIGLSYLYNAANVNLEEFQLQAQMIIPLTKRTGNYAILDRMEAAVGRTAIRLPEAGKEPIAITDNIFAMVRQVGELSGQFLEAQKDNIIDSIEGKRMEKITMELIQSCAEFISAVAHETRR